MSAHSWLRQASITLALVLPAAPATSSTVASAHPFVVDHVDAFGSPTIQHDLHVFDQTFGLPDPPSLRIIQPVGAVPPFDPNAFNGDMVTWAQETTLDVEWSHVMAPGATILLVETPVDETEGVQGFPR